MSILQKLEQNPTIKLIVLEDQETCELGLMIEGTPVIQYPMVANEGLLIAHDLFEHPNGVESIGSVDDELEALGGIWFVRGQHGYLRKRDYFSPSENLVGDVVNLGLIHLGGVKFKTPVPELNEDSPFYWEASWICDQAFSQIEKECDGDYTTEQIKDYLSDASAYMVAGYDKLEEQDGDTLQRNTLFHRLAECVDSLIEFEQLHSEYQEFTVHYNKENLTFAYQEHYEFDEEEDY